MRRMGWFRLQALALAVVVAAPSVAVAQDAVNPRARALKDFRGRVDDYVKLREKVRGEMGKLNETSDPKEITMRERALGDAVRAARPAARQGDIFTPDVSRILRDTIRSNFRQRSPKERQAALAGLPDNVGLKINGFYPSTVPLATVPPTLLAQLPPLPESVEYRLVGSSLILRDVNANVIIDYVPNALPKPGA